ncbi:hypothetical protein FNV61_56775 [Streptomyces sp. RLB3-6]|nr:hypothetical protein FNV61_56775 [Streptomyces sp. RLB3-6]
MRTAARLPKADQGRRFKSAAASARRATVWDDGRKSARCCHCSTCTSSVVRRLRPGAVALPQQRGRAAAGDLKELGRFAGRHRKGEEAKYLRQRIAATVQACTSGCALVLLQLARQSP